MLTNLQRGNTQTELPLPYDGSNVDFYTLAGQGELTPDKIPPGKFIHLNHLIKYEKKN